MDALVIDDLQVRYPSGFTVGPFSAKIFPGFTQLIGANGSGKTTIMRALCGDIPATGSVTYAEADILNNATARKNIAFVPAKADSPDFLTVDELWQTAAALRGSPKWDGHKIRDSFELPGNLPLSHASVGQRQRAELLAGFAGDPPVLLLDEPFAHLDKLGVELLKNWIQTWRRERIIIMTHHGELSFTPNRRIGLDHGCVSESHARLPRR